MKKVLIADDTKNIRLLLMKCLQLEGYEVRTANDGYAAIESLVGEDFDLAFIDIKMPYLSGTEVIRTIREKGVKTPVIVITAYATVKNAVECTQMGAVAYLQKPFTADKVKAVLKEYLEETAVKSSSTEITLRTVRELIGKCEYSRALSLLKGLLPDEATNHEVYLLLGRAYGGLGNSDLEGRFRRVGEIFSPIEHNQ